MKKFLAYIKIFFYGVENLFSINLGDIVIYQGKEYFVNNGVSAPAYDLLPEQGEVILVHKSNFKKKRCWYNFTHAFKFAYNFYITNWLDIWMNNWSTKEMLQFTLRNHKWFNYGKTKGAKDGKR